MTSPDRSNPEGGNRLALETSPYLLKHAGNPVDWHPWGEEAFEKARAEDKPVFLSIGYSTCYWCSVMERESFVDPGIGELMNRCVVSIKVDREERPDLDGIYMTAVMLMTGSGGWPMSVFLTPDRKPFFGATYIPRDRFAQLLEAVRAAWAERPDEVRGQAEQVVRAVEEAGRMPGGPSASLPGPELAATAAARFAEMFDPRDGGFGGAPKFPQSSILEFLMSHFETAGDRSSLAMAERTLQAMADGGIHDQAGGGFHRYSTDARWLVPHFEKMLYDQAQLLHAYARAGAITGNPGYRRTAMEIVEYLRREMQSPRGMFYSAQDSEVDGEEGKSYVWTAEELRRACGEKGYPLASRTFGFSGAPAFEGRHILHRPVSFENTARAEGMPLPDLLREVDSVRAGILAERGKRRQPLLDDKSIASWNGLLIEALSYAGRVWEEAGPVRMAERAAKDLLQTLRDGEGRLLHVARDGRAKIAAFLDDYAAVILGLLELARATGDSRWSKEADRLGSEMVDLLREEEGGFRYTVPSVTDLIASPRDGHDGAVPSGNSLAVRALTGLAAAGYVRYASHAAATLRAFSNGMRRNPASLPYMLWGSNEYRLANLSEEGMPAPDGLPSTAGQVKVEGKLSTDTLSPGKPAELAVSLTVAAGWHVNANPASLPSLIPTTLSVELPGGEATATPRYPPGKVLSVGTSGDRLSVYENRVDLTARIVPVRLPSGNGEGRLAVSVRAQACDDTGRCLAPATIRIEVPFRLTPP